MTCLIGYYPIAIRIRIRIKGQKIAGIGHIIQNLRLRHLSPDSSSGVGEAKGRKLSEISEVDSPVFLILDVLH